MNGFRKTKLNQAIHFVLYAMRHFECGIAEVGDKTIGSMKNTPHV